MTKDKMREVIQSMQLVSDDCVADAAKYDGRPLTGPVMGEIHGNLLAMIQSVALANKALAQELLKFEDKTGETT